MDFLNLSIHPSAWLVGYAPPCELVADFVLKGTFDLVHDGVATPAEWQDHITGDTPEREETPEQEASSALRYTRDLTASKTAVDLLMVGTAHAPGGKPVDTLGVTFRVGDWEKSLVVVGDRVETRGVLGRKPGNPIPFVSMPLGWERAAGGSQSRFNPDGRGLDEIMDDAGRRMVPMPNIVDVDSVSKSVGKDDEPQGFGPVSPDWQQRAAIARNASFGTSWLEDTWPAPPSDFDWSYFNAALPDQRVPLGQIAGDEPLELVNLHPEHPHFRSRLPGLRARWFLGVEPEGEPCEWREVEMQIDTLHVDADTGKLVLIWRGQSGLLTRGMKEVVDILIATEPMSEDAKPAEHYRSLLEEKKKERDEQIAAAEAEAEKAAEEAGMPSEVEEFQPEPPNDFDWEAWEEKMVENREKLVADAQKAMEDGMADHMSAAADAMEQAGVPTDVLGVQPITDPTANAEAAAKLIEDTLAANPEVPGLMPPEFAFPTADQMNADKIIEDIKTEISEKMAEPVTPDEIAAAEEAAAAGEEPAAAVEEAGAAAEEADDEDADEDWTRDSVEEHAEEVGTFEEEDLRDLDLSGHDLSGVTFVDCTLDRTNFTGAVLNDTRFVRCEMPRVSLRVARASGAVFEDCDLNGAALGGATLERVDFSGCDLTGARLLEARLTGVTATMAVFYRAVFTGATISGCDFTRADFGQAQVAGVDFGGSTLDGVNAYGIRADGAIFNGCSMSNFRGGDGSSFIKAEMREIEAPGSVWEDAILDEAYLGQANLAGSNFSYASLVQADLMRSNLAGARLPGANLTGALLFEANLFRASLENAILRLTDFRGANLYEAEFLETMVDNSMFEGANLKGTKLA